MVQVRDHAVIPTVPVADRETTAISTLVDSIPIRQRAPRPSTHAYIPGLDGLRALAVIAVLLYHADIPWARGGFLGVDVFFVLSGYLITTLLATEWANRGGIDLASFWRRRARRLLPALYFMLAVVLGFFAVFLRGEVASIRGDLLAALGYVTNWYLIFGQKSYFEAIGRPSPLQHLWSLAVEEQFYLLWPLLFVAGMNVLRRQWLLFATLMGAIISTVLAAVWYNPLVDPSRLYYGTDTRAVALLLGASLALVIGVNVPPSVASGEEAAPLALGRRAVAVALDVAGLCGLIVLAVWVVRLDAYAPFLYRGGFALVALASAVVIAAIVHPRARVLPTLLGGRVLRWIGVRSYGIYLWHWPIVTVTRPHLDLGLDGVPLLALRVVLTVGLAALSYRFVEVPIRSGALGRAWDTLRTARGSGHTLLRARWITALGAIIAVTASLAVVVAEAQPAPPPAYLSVTAVHITSVPRSTAPTPSSTPTFAISLATNLSAILATASLPTTVASPTPSAITTSSSSLLAKAKVPTNPMPTPAPSTATTPATVSPTMPPTAMPTTPPSMPSAAPSPMASPPMDSPMMATPVPATAPPVVAQTAPPPLHVYAIGDSVMVGAAGAMQNDIGDIEIDAAVSRQASTAIDILRAKRDAGELGGAVIVHMGTNGTFTAEQFDAMMQILANVPRVVFVNVKASRPWEAGDNDVIAAGVQRYPNTVLADWHSLGISHPEYFWGDGIHLQPTGAQAYADLLTAAVNS